MCSILRLYASCLAALLVPLAAAAPVSAGPAPVTGKLSKPGYTLIAVAADGKATAVLAQDGGFSLVPPADAVTLHLRAPDGTYGGPVVLRDDGGKVKGARAAVKRARRAVTKAKRAVRKARQGVRSASGERAKRAARKRWRKARKQLSKANRHLRSANGLLARALKEEADSANRTVLGVKAGAALGNVDVNSTAGYALVRLPESVSKTAVDATRTARATNGVPIGAGNFGFVMATPEGTGVPGDRDTDGVADPLDVDNDGDLILNNFERPAVTARAAQGGPVQDLVSILSVPLEDAANVNAGGLSVERLDTTLRTYGVLFTGHMPAPEKELDCRGLTYCSLPDSTGTVAFDQPGKPPHGSPYPACCDSDDGDGFGTVWNGFALAHGAATAKFDSSGNRIPGGIGTGDVLIERVNSGGVETSAFLMAVQTVFASVPALISYSDSAGNTGNVTYPVPEPYTGSPPGLDRVREGFPVSAGPDGNVVLTFTFWRPQRLPLEGEQGSWIDIGDLLWSAEPANVLPGGRTQCPQSTFSNGFSLSDGQSPPERQPLPPERVKGGGGFRDPAPNRAADPQNRLTFTLNVTQCLAAHGLSWEHDQPMEIWLSGTNGFDEAAQRLYFKRQ